MNYFLLEQYLFASREVAGTSGVPAGIDPIEWIKGIKLTPIQRRHNIIFSQKLRLKQILNLFKPFSINFYLNNWSKKQ